MNSRTFAGVIIALVFARCSAAVGEDLPCLERPPASSGAPGCAIGLIVATSVGFELSLVGDADIRKRLTPGCDLDRNFGDQGVVTTSGLGEHFVIGATVTGSSEFYVAGTATAEPDPTTYWRIEKRSVSTGLPIARFGEGGVVRSNPGAERVEVRALATDDDFLYIAGTDEDHEWRVERRDLKTGELYRRFGDDGAVTSRVGTPLGIASDGNVLLIAGIAASSGTLVVEHRTAADGALENESSSDFTLDPQDPALKVSAGGNFLYLQTPRSLRHGATKIAAERGKTDSFALGFGSTSPAVADIALQLVSRRSAKRGPLDIYSLPACGVTVVDLRE